MKRCPKCQTILEDSYLFCPECGRPVAKEKNYWLDKRIWAIFIILVLITLPMQRYLNNLSYTNTDIEQSGGAVDNKSSDQKLSEAALAGQYIQATNINYLGITYTSETGIYITINQQVIKYSDDFSSQEVIVSGYKTAFSEDDSYYYYVDENNNYQKMDKETKEEVTLLENVYYVHKLNDVVYYQNDDDNESIHCLDLNSNEDDKLNDEVSYCLTIDQDKDCLFYVDSNNQLKSIDLKGHNEKIIGRDTSVYTYDGQYLYYLTSTGLMKSDLDGNGELIYSSTTVKLINMIGDQLLLQDGYGIYQMDRDGNNVEEIYTSLFSLTFEVIDDQLLVLTNNGIEVSYLIVQLDGTSRILHGQQTGIEV